METRYSGHGVYRAEYHIVWIPKYRRRILNPGLAEYLRWLLGRLVREMPGVEIVELNIQEYQQDQDSGQAKLDL